jgi:hypothetical protein
MRPVQKPPPKRLKLVRLDGPLGDLSGMTAAERAEIVQQDGRRRIYEEIVQAEMEAWRKFFLWGGMCAGGWTLGVLVRVGMEFLHRSSVDFPLWLWHGAMLLVSLGVLLGVVAFWPALILFGKLLAAMHRRRRAARGPSLRR